MTARRRRVLLCVLALGLASQAHALVSGFETSDILPPGGCNGCHSGGQTPTVSLTGPTTVLPGDTNLYTLQIPNVGAQTKGGLDAFSLAGALSKDVGDASTQERAGAGGLVEITHVGAKSSVGGVTTFAFQWTAPNPFSGSAVLNAWGNAVNGNSSSIGDQAAFTTLTVFASGSDGAACSAAGDCASGFCVDGVCCNVAACGPGEACNVPGSEGQCGVAPTATPTRTATATPSSTPTAIPPMHDAVVLPVHPFSVEVSELLPALRPFVERKFRVIVRNADPAAEGPKDTIQLKADPGDCPASMEMVAPNFSRPGEPPSDTVQLDGGRWGIAVMSVKIHTAEFRNFNHKSPKRCALMLTVSTSVAGNVDPTPWNNTLPLEINVVDKSLVENSPLHESIIKSVAPLRVRLLRTEVTATRTASAVVVNADYLDPLNEGSGHQIQVSVDPIVGCPWLMVASLDATVSQPGLQSTLTLKGGGRSIGAIGFRVVRSVSVPNRFSPQRCIVTLRATTNVPGNVEPDPRNNTTQLVVDAVDINDL